MFTISNYRNGRRDFPSFSVLEMMAADKAVMREE